MALSKENRIYMSKKILSADQDLIANAMNQVAVAARVADLQIEDDANKQLLSLDASKIDSYEEEIKLIDGHPRTKVTESDFLNAVSRSTGNFLMPADVNAPIPSIPTGVWTKFTPFCLSGAIGLSYNQTPNAPISDYEELVMPSLLSAIATIEGFPQIRVVTGQKCIAAVPPATDLLADDVDVQSAMNSLISLTNTLHSVLLSQKSVLVSNPDTANQANINTAINSIDDTILAINTWLAYPTFNPLPLSTDCPSFNSYNPALLSPTKGYSSQLSAFKSSMMARSSFVPSRKNEINTALGTVSQDLNTGYFLSSSGFYGGRANLINTRLNAITGSLSKLFASNNGVNALQQEAQSTIATKNVLSSYLNVTKLSSVTNGTSFVTVVSSSGFVVGQRAYIVSDTQDEQEVVIQSINGTSIQINKAIPPVYRPTEMARLYVDKT